MSTETKPPYRAAPPTGTSIADQDKELVKGLGLTSATMLVMGSMIGSGIFIVSAEISPRGRFARAADRRLAGHRLPDHRRGAQLRRTGRHDAARRRPICLSARSAGAAVGISLRLDAFSGNPDRNHRRRGRGLRQVSRHLLSFDFFLATGSCTSGRFRPFISAHGAGQHGCRAEHAEPGGDSGGGRRCRSSISSA